MKNHEIPFPPKTLGQLRRIPPLIRQGELGLPMGRRSFNALCSMLDQPQLVAMNNITGLARVLKISPASLTRLAKLLGFSGFPPFQSLFRQQLSQPERFYSQQAKALLDNRETADQGSLQVLGEQCCRNINQAQALIDQKALERTVEWLAQAPRVHIFGYRQSASMASLMSYGLGMIRSNVIQLGSNSQGVSLGLAQLRRQDQERGHKASPEMSKQVEFVLNWSE